jgi:hypothetical protein
VADPPVAAIERPGVAGLQGAHAPGERAGARADQEVGVIGDARPGEDGEGTRLRERRQAPDEVRPVDVVPEMARRSRPRTITWWNVCGASKRACRGMVAGTLAELAQLGNVPYYYWFALPSQEDTALHHTRSPRCSGSLLRGSLAITTTDLHRLVIRAFQGTPCRVRPQSSRCSVPVTTTQSFLEPDHVR